MKVILKDTVEKLGTVGEVVTVKNGYGRNFLIPNGLAVIATKGNVRAVEELKRQASLKLSKLKEEAEALATRLASIELSIPAKAGDEGRLFGTVTTQQIADALVRKGLEIDRRKIKIAEDIKMLGVYTASVKLHPEVEASVKVHVVNEAEAE